MPTSDHDRVTAVRRNEVLRRERTIPLHLLLQTRSQECIVCRPERQFGYISMDWRRSNDTQQVYHRSLQSHWTLEGRESLAI
jgi:hypothetical protein